MSKPIRPPADPLSAFASSAAAACKLDAVRSLLQAVAWSLERSQGPSADRREQAEAQAAVKRRRARQGGPQTTKRYRA